MQNLAGSKDSSLRAAQELEQADIPIKPAVEPDRETGALVEGAFEVGGHRFQCVRRWAYWSVNVTPPLPVDVAARLNSAPGPGGGSHYSGGGKNLGAVARAHGFACGMDERMLREWGSCDSWHIDTPEGLVAFARWCRENLQGVVQEDPVHSRLDRLGSAIDGARREAAERYQELEKRLALLEALVTRTP